MSNEDLVQREPSSQSVCVGWAAQKVPAWFQHFTASWWPVGTHTLASSAFLASYHTYSFLFMPQKQPGEATQSCLVYLIRDDQITFVSPNPVCFSKSRCLSASLSLWTRTPDLTCANGLVYPASTKMCLKLRRDGFFYVREG